MLRNHHVLIVDDQPIVRKVLKVVLERLNPSLISQAGSADEARQAINDAPPSLIICDINMAPTNGLDLLEEIRAGKLGDAQVPLIFLTSNTGKDIIEKAVSLGANGYLAKPVTADNLQLVLTKVLSPVGE